MNFGYEKRTPAGWDGVSLEITYKLNLSQAN